EQGSLVLRAGQDLEQLRVERHYPTPGQVPPTRCRPSSPFTAFLLFDESEDALEARFELVSGAGLEVEAEKGFGVRGPHVEPPAAEVDGEPVETILVGAGERQRHPLDGGLRIGDPSVDLARVEVALEGLADLGERSVRPAQDLQHDEGG